jgi:hypothetical protein
LTRKSAAAQSLYSRPPLVILREVAESKNKKSKALTNDNQAAIIFKKWIPAFAR